MTLELRSEIWMGMVEEGEKSSPNRWDIILKGPLCREGLQTEYRLIGFGCKGVGREGA